MPIPAVSELSGGYGPMISGRSTSPTSNDSVLTPKALISDQLSRLAGVSRPRRRSTTSEDQQAFDQGYHEFGGQQPARLGIAEGQRPQHRVGDAVDRQRQQQAVRMVRGRLGLGRVRHQPSAANARR